MVKLIWPALIAVSVPGWRSNPPAGIFRPTLASDGPRNWVEPASTANAPLSVALAPVRNAFSAADSPEVSAPVATDFTVNPAGLRTDTAPSKRGWMLPEPGVAMKMTTSPGLEMRDLIRFPIATPEL